MRECVCVCAHLCLFVAAKLGLARDASPSSSHEKSKTRFFLNTHGTQIPAEEEEEEKGLWNSSQHVLQSTDAER